MSKLLKHAIKIIKTHLLLIFLLCGLIIGVCMGLGLRASGLVQDWDKRQFMYFRFPGDLLMRMLKALVIPLIVSSLISGLAKLDASSSRIGLYAIAYYMSTTFIAVIIGLILVTSIGPGFRSEVELKAGSITESANIFDSFLDLLRNIFPDNILEAAFRQTKTKFISINIESDNITSCVNDSGQCNRTSETKTDFFVAKEYGVNAIGLVVFSLALGVAVGKLGEAGRPLYLLCSSLADCTMLLITAVIWYSPLGIIFLIASEIIQMTNPLKELEALGWYMLTVLMGLLIHGLIVLPSIYLIFVRKNPFKYLFQTSQALITAFGTSSSSAALPVTYLCLEEKLNIDRRVSRFILPVGATINMDGTALYEAVAAIFIAQSNGMSLNAAEIIAVSITATLASIGAASVPQAGLVTMVLVLSTVGLPPEEISKIIAIDWLLDRFRTTVNVEGDAIGAGIVNHLCRKYLAENYKDNEETLEVDRLNNIDKNHSGLIDKRQTTSL